VIDLHLRQHRLSGRRLAAGRPQSPGGPAAPPARRSPWTGSSLAIRRTKLPREGTGSPRLRHTRPISRHTAATERFWRVR
jgi:hypothetical protein